MVSALGPLVGGALMPAADRWLASVDLPFGAPLSGFHVLLAGQFLLAWLAIPLMAGIRVGDEMALDWRQLAFRVGNPFRAVLNPQSIAIAILRMPKPEKTSDKKDNAENPGEGQ